METQAQSAHEKWGFGKKRMVWTIVAIVLVGLLLGGFTFRNFKRPQSLLPETVASQITGFTPYFFFDKIPNGYSLNERSIGFDQNIMIVPLIKSGDSTIVLTQQALSQNLSQELLEQEDSIKIKGTAAEMAIINKVEGRMVGIMTSKKYNLLLLINAPANTPEEIITELLQELKPIK